MKALFADSGFTLTKWFANIEDILDEVLESDYAPQARYLRIHSFHPGAQGAIGLKWIPQQNLLTLCGIRVTRKGELRKRDV